MEPWAVWPRPSAACTAASAPSSRAAVTAHDKRECRQAARCRGWWACGRRTCGTRRCPRRLLRLMRQTTLSGDAKVKTLTSRMDQETGRTSTHLHSLGLKASQDNPTPERHRSTWPLACLSQNAATLSQFTLRLVQGHMQPLCAELHRHTIHIGDYYRYAGLRSSPCITFAFCRPSSTSVCPRQLTTAR
jgi:hypothetical protein